VTIASVSRSRNEAPPAGGQGAISARIDLRYAGRTSVDVRYEITGPAKGAILFVAGGISADRHVLSNRCDPADGWWQAQSAPFAGHRVLAMDWVGADGRLDRPIDASDQARALVEILDALEIDRLAAFVGASYGAMVGMHVAAIAPERVGALLSISAADRAHPFASAHRTLQRQAIEFAERLGSPEAGVALARKLAILSYRTCCANAHSACHSPRGRP
jgi:homoserine O-acetyltransferase/O-succinyltransferase